MRSPLRARRALVLAGALGFLVAQACSGSSSATAPSAGDAGCVETNGAACTSALQGAQCSGVVCVPCGNQTWSLGPVVTCTCTGSVWSCPGAAEAGACAAGAALYANPSCTVLFDADGGEDEGG